MASPMKHTEHLKIQIEAIRLATEDFTAANCIGKGGFGKVYKGELIHHNGRSLVALKRLNRAFGQGDPEFWKEIMMLSYYQHENIISLLGYCADSGEKILIYEYASKGSLDQYLNSHELNWNQRLKICIGAARGLAYLHLPTENKLRVLHRDVKSSNILLDENWNAKISDFGLSKFEPVNQQFSFLVSNAVGTLGYCDPLYIETGLLTKESDVYSFGVVLFEVLCGRLCIGDKRDLPLTGLARLCYEENRLDEIIQGSIKDEIKLESLKTFTRIAYRCLKRDREQRPSMVEIIKELELALDLQLNKLAPSSYINELGFLKPPANIGQSKQSNSTFVKVYKSGCSEMSIDVAKFSGYKELRSELARMFGLEGQLEDRWMSSWKLVYVDMEGDFLLLGDDPWENFVSLVQCIKILSLQELEHNEQDRASLFQKSSDSQQEI